MAVLTPSTTTGFNSQVWADTIEATTQQKMVLVPTIDEFPGRILNTGNVNKQARATGSTLAQSAEGLTLTYDTITGTPVTIAPVGRYVAVAWSENEDAQVQQNLDRVAADNIERALAEITDKAGLAVVPTLTQSISGTGVDGAMWRQAVGRIMENMNGETMPGDGQLMVIFSPTQYPNVIAISEFTDADVRGDSENPHVKGIFTRGGGVQVMFSTVVAQDANGWHNPLYVRKAFIVGWNVRTRIKRQDIELQNRIVVYNNCGFSVLHDLRAQDLRTTASGL